MLAKNFRRPWMKFKIFFCQFPNPWALRVSGWVVIPQNVKKSQNHCTLVSMPSPFHTTITSKVVYAPAEKADTLPLFLLYLYLYSVCIAVFTPVAGVLDEARQSTYRLEPCPHPM